MTRLRVVHGLAAGGLLVLIAGLGWQLAERASTSARVDESAKRKVLRGYRRLAHYSYEAAYHSAGRLRTSISELLAEPSAETLQSARQAWRAARADYSQTEVFRFGNWIVDAWEADINAWPVDEGVLDYVADDYTASATNPLARQNLVARPSLVVGGVELDTAALSWQQLEFIHGASDIEANVVLGYHAIEFLLWGQDLRTAETGPGQRPWTDYARQPQRCTSGPRAAPLEHCQRRRRLIRAMTEHLYSELGRMTLKWAGNNPNSYGLHIAEGDTDEGLRRMLFGMIRLAGDEMAGERMQVALLSGAPEEEQDCFSDDTHRSIHHNGRGIENIYYGRLRNPDYRDGQPYAAPLSLADLARRRAPELADRIDQAFLETRAALTRLRELGDSGQTFDLLIRPDHPDGGAAIRRAIQALEAQSRLLERLGRALDLGALNPQAVRPPKRS